MDHHIPWNLPNNNPTTHTSLLTIDTSGNMGYSASSSTTQVLVSTGNTPTWQEQDVFGGINMNATSVPFGNSFTTYGVVVNNGTSGSSFLRTVNPGTTAVNSANQVLTTDTSGNIVWSPSFIYLLSVVMMEY